MNLRDLQYVVAVADHGHFGRAAAACNISQPTLSGQILKLEAELGVRIFEREGRAVAVAARAEPIVDHARRALAAVAEVAAAARGARDPLAGPLRIGIIPTVGPYLLPYALPALIRDLPQAPLAIVEDLTARLLSLVLERKIDAAVIATDPGDRKLEILPLYEDPSCSSPRLTIRSRRAKGSRPTTSTPKRCCCSRTVIACATRRSLCAGAAQADAPRAPTSAQPASRRCSTSPPPATA